MRVLVIGDSCQDVFVYGDIERISPEAPVPVFKPTSFSTNDGMARNVSHNVEALEMHITTITNKNGIVKRRYVDNRSGQMVLRVDEDDYCDRIEWDVLSKIEGNKCTPNFGSEINIDAIIVSDYCKGFLHEDDIKYICECNDNVFVDTKKKLGNWISDCTYLKINDLEYEENKSFFKNNPIYNNTIITKGSKGCLFKDKLHPTESVPVKDISGAGDTFLAGLVVEYVRTNDIVKAITFAQQCTKIVVQRHGVSTVK